MRIQVSYAFCLVWALLPLTVYQKSVITQLNRDSSSPKGVAYPNAQNPMFARGHPESAVDGRFMNAFLVAHEAFKNEDRISGPKKRLENYTIEFRQDRDTYFVYFKAKQKADQKADGVIQGGGETDMGVDVTYAIRKSDWHITARQFYK